MWAILAIAVGAILGGIGCAPRPHFTVKAPPTPPEQISPVVADHATLPVTVAIENFRVFDETKYPPNERELLRRTFSVEVPNLLFEALGQRNAFARVERMSHRGSVTGAYLVAGTYDYFDQLGGGSLGRIPFYGTYGTMIRAWVRETIEIVLLDARTGATVWRRSYTDEHRQLGRSWEGRHVEYLQPEFMGRVADGLVDAIERARNGGGR